MRGSAAAAAACIARTADSVAVRGPGGLGVRGSRSIARSVSTSTEPSSSSAAADAEQAAHHAHAYGAPSASASASASASSSASSSSPFSEQEQRLRRQNRVMLDYVANLGSTQTRQSSYRPFKSRLDPLTAKELTVSHLLAATAQMGHTTSSLARANQANVYGVRHKLAIIDVEKATLPALRRAAAVVRAICERDGVVLFLGTRPGQQAAVIAAAQRLGDNGYHVTTDRWLPGSITNAPKLLSGAVTHALASSPALQEATASGRGRGGGSSSSNASNVDKLAALTLQPDLLVVLNPTENLHAIREATQCHIPTMAIVDTDVDPRAVTYPIPANDDSLRAVELIVGVLSKAGQQGLRDRQRKLDEQDKLLRRAAAAARRSPPSSSHVGGSASAAARAAAGPQNEYAEARDAEANEDVEAATAANTSREARRLARENKQ